MTRLLATLALLLTTSTALHAMLDRYEPPAFSMPICVSESKLIVKGFLDEKGNVAVNEIFKGDSVPSTLALVDGSKTYQQILASISPAAAAATNPIEVVALLYNQTNNAWRQVEEYAGVIGLEDTNVYLITGMSRWAKPPQWVAISGEHSDREGFLAMLKEEVKTSNQRDAIFAMPRTTGRTQKLILFLLNHRDFFNYWKITYSLSSINSDEQKEIIKEIIDTDDVATKCFLIGFLTDSKGVIHLSADAFDSFTPMIDSGNPPSIRRAAMAAISHIDSSRATQYLLPLIDVKELELDAAVTALQTSTELPLALKVTDALLSLSKQIQRREAERLPSIPAAAQQALFQQLGNYAHPKLVGFYDGWLFDDKQPSSDFALAGLQTMLGVKWPREQLAAWWKQQRAAIESDYNLEQAAGCNAWLANYQSADEISRHLLMRLWILTSKPDEIALVKAATEEKTANTAKTIVTELWQGERLGNDGKKAMFENFLKIDFVDDTNLFGSMNHHELKIIGTMTFPFNTEIEYHHNVSIDGKRIIPSDSFDSSVVLEPSTKQFDFGGLGGGVVGKWAAATLEIRQIEHYPDGKELWYARWDLGPIKLHE
jgi:hypothetical protein